MLKKPFVLDSFTGPARIKFIQCQASLRLSKLSRNHFLVLFGLEGGGCGLFRPFQLFYLTFEDSAVLFSSRLTFQSQRAP